MLLLLNVCSIKSPGGGGVGGGGGGGHFESIFSWNFHFIFPNFTTTPITKTEQEIGYVSPFNKCNAIHTQTQQHFWKLKTKFQLYKVTGMQGNIAETPFTLA